MQPRFCYRIKDDWAGSGCGFPPPVRVFSGCVRVPRRGRFVCGEEYDGYAVYEAPGVHGGARGGVSTQHEFADNL
ncbi:hypothetical protein KEA62_00695 [Treponema pallidum]|uniref:hypothetical protein n=1 Tax=Treponema pallidum TaxID=160 RepID=UPI0013EED87B|nr:hypothetical protein [Treponema pallidum]QUL05548.1 hypothetical protein KD949_00695 [Treponema pallidum]QUL24849.1 hypothetical protein KEA53_00695 [Treponema pallidum]QUL27745.1 hypothetical protein KEA62_00695 [Treponema pallidum]QUL28715.1 hypothetical protein KEA09_00695 [Treponema pallidum]